MKWLKRVSGILAVLSFAVIVFFRWPIGLSFKIKEAGAVGIIGGADGPTAIYHTTAIWSCYRIALFAAPVFLVIWLVLHIKSKK